MTIAESVQDCWPRRRALRHDRARAHSRTAAQCARRSHSPVIGLAKCVMLEDEPGLLMQSKVVRPATR